MGVRARSTDCHAELRAKKPIRQKNSEYNNNRTNEENIRRRIEAPDIPFRKQGLLLK